MREFTSSGKATARRTIAIPPSITTRWMERTTRVASFCRQGAPQTNAATITRKLPPVHITTPREALIRAAPISAPMVTKTMVLLFLVLRIRYPPKPKRETSPIMIRSWNRPALTKTEVGRYAARPVIGETRYRVLNPRMSSWITVGFKKVDPRIDWATPSATTTNINTELKRKKWRNSSSDSISEY